MGRTTIGVLGAAWGVLGLCALLGGGFFHSLRS